MEAKFEMGFGLREKEKGRKWNEEEKKERIPLSFRDCFHGVERCMRRNGKKKIRKKKKKESEELGIVEGFEFMDLVVSDMGDLISFSGGCLWKALSNYEFKIFC